jgi:hypothetical protein
MRAYLRTEAYPVYVTHRYPPAVSTGSPVGSYERNAELIAAAKNEVDTASGGAVT